MKEAGIQPQELKTPWAPAILQMNADAEIALAGKPVKILKPSALLEVDLASLLRRHAAYFVGLQETRRLLSTVESEYKDLVREAQRAAPVQKIADVLRRLLEEGVPIRNMRLILEAILEWAPKEQDVVGLTGRVRHSLKRQICFRLSGPDRVLLALLIEREAEDALRAASQEATARNAPTVDMETITAFRDTIRAKLHHVSAAAADSAVVLVAADLRRLVPTMLVKADLGFPVLSYSEVAPEFTVRTLATIGPPAPRQQRPRFSPEPSLGLGAFEQNIALEPRLD